MFFDIKMIRPASPSIVMSALLTYINLGRIAMDPLPRQILTFIVDLQNYYVSCAQYTRHLNGSKSDLLVAEKINQTIFTLR